MAISVTKQKGKKKTKKKKKGKIERETCGLPFLI